jgi:hypothetical protein
MAALLPGAERDDAFGVKVEGGKLVATIGTERVAGAPARRQYLAEWAKRTGRAIEIATVDRFLERQPAHRASGAASSTLVVAWTTEVDEAGPIAGAVSFDVVMQVLDKCVTFIDTALGAGFAEVVVATDHGFLLTDPNGAPGGVSGTQPAGGDFARGLRYAAGRGDSGDLLALSAKKLGRVGVDVFVPKGTGCLALPGGAGSFVHGGLSPEECVLLFLRVHAGDGRRPRAISVRLDVPATVTSLVFRVDVHAGPAPGAPDRLVRLLVRDASGRDVWLGRPVTIAGADQERTYSETVTVKGAGYHHVVLEDAGSAAILEQREIHVEVLGDDFGF